jgi:hypothetical protein
MDHPRKSIPADDNAYQLYSNKAPSPTRMNPNDMNIADDGTSNSIVATATAESYILQGGAPSSELEEIFYSSFTNPYIKSVVLLPSQQQQQQQSDGSNGLRLDGVILQTAVDLVRISSSVFLHRFIIALQSIDTETVQLNNQQYSMSPTTKSNSPSPSSIDSNKLLLDRIRHMIATNEEYQFLEGVYDNMEEVYDTTFRKKRTSQSTLLSDIPQRPLQRKRLSRTSHKHTDPDAIPLSEQPKVRTSSRASAVPNCAAPVFLLPQSTALRFSNVAEDGAAIQQYAAAAASAASPTIANDSNKVVWDEENYD